MLKAASRRHLYAEAKRHGYDLGRVYRSWAMAADFLLLMAGIGGPAATFFGADAALVAFFNLALPVALVWRFCLYLEYRNERHGYDESKTLEAFAAHGCYCPPGECRYHTTPFEDYQDFRYGVGGQSAQRATVDGPFGSYQMERVIFMPGRAQMREDRDE